MVGPTDDPGTIGPGQTVDPVEAFGEGLEVREAGMCLTVGPRRPDNSSREEPADGRRNSRQLEWFWGGSQGFGGGPQGFGGGGFF